ncbi:MAG: glycosyltransferase family 4 protein [Sedimentisphaerales bacterium]|nr:glycosyltransferase family 4 protein [Sedimentisphaerales bacterium]
MTNTTTTLCCKSSLPETTSTMHVAMVTVFPDDPHRIDGGVAGAARYLVEEFRKQPDLKVTVIALGNHSGRTKPEQWENVTVYRLAKQGLWKFLPGTLYYIFSGKRQIQSLLRQINPNIVHFQGFTFLAANCDRPSVMTIHGIAEEDAKWDSRWSFIRQPRRLFMKLTEAYARRRISHVIAISKYTKQFLPENNYRKIWRIENPVAESYFNIEWKLEPRRILCCARIRPLKNILGLIKAFALIAEQLPHAQLRIAGTPEADYLVACKQEVETNGLKDKVHFLDNISINEVQLELSKANCLVVPSFQENAPLTIAEAMAAGVPVVASNVGGIPEMIEDEKTGLLIDPYDTKSMSDAILKILFDETLARSIGQSAKETAQDRYSASIACEKTLRVYREILRHSNKTTVLRFCHSERSEESESLRVN